MSRPLLLDLFSGAGGAARGYHDAGFEVVGVDVKPQPRYPYRFVQEDALAFLRANGASFDAVHASPPCQKFSAMRTMPDAKEHPDLVGPVREILQSLGRPYVIENVPGAPLLNPITLCGTMFGLGWEDAELRRHRLFESNVLLLQPACRHGDRATIGVYGGHIRNRKRARTIGVYGEGVRDSRRKTDRGHSDFRKEVGEIAMQISWMSIAELCQAIPPAYTKFIGEQLMQALR